MSRFLHRAISRALGRASDPRPFSGLFLASASPSAAGHLGFLARTHPNLKNLLTPEALLLDATHALGAVSLHEQPHTGRANRFYHDVIAPAELARAEAQGNFIAAEHQHILMALLDLEDGRFVDGFGSLVRLAERSPAALLCVAAVSDLLGKTDDGDRMLAGIPQVERPREEMMFQFTLVAATLGGVPVAVFAGSEGRVASAAFRIINHSISEGKISAFQILVAGLLKHAAKRKCKDLAHRRDDDDGIFCAVADAIHHAISGDEVPEEEEPPIFVLKASQALLSAVVLRAEQPLHGEGVRAALRVAQRDLARAVTRRDAPAAVAEVRLLVAFLAARDGRFDEALERYAEMARDDPSDPRPHLLSPHVCVFAGMPAEDADKWLASYNRLTRGSSSDEQVALTTLADELAVALALGGSRIAFDKRFPIAMRKTVNAAGSMVDAALVSALRDKDKSMVERLEARAARALLHAGLWSALKELKGDEGSSGTARD